MYTQREVWAEFGCFRTIFGPWTIGVRAAKKRDPEVLMPLTSGGTPPPPGGVLDKQRRDMSPQNFPPAAGYNVLSTDT